MTTAVQVTLTAQSGRPPFAERHGGLLISIFFHVMLIALLARHVVVTPPQPVSDVPTIQIALAPPPPPPPPPPVEIPATFDEVARTSQRGEEDDTARDDTDLLEIGLPPTFEADSEAEEGEADPAETAEGAARERADLPDDPTREAPPTVDEEFLQWVEAREALARAEVERQIIARTEIQGRLWAEREEQRTRNAEFDSAGERDGRTRMIDFGNVPRTIAQQVLREHGATLGRGVIDPSELPSDGPITINAARLPDGQVLTAQRQLTPGVGDYLSYGTQLSAHLTALEREELVRRSISPSRVAITRSVFGFERDDASGWGITLQEIEWVEVD